MKLAFKIAVRFLKSSKGQTILIALGIAIGVSVQIFIGTLINGLQKSLIDKTVGSSSQITITSKNDDGAIKNWQEKVKKIKSSNNNISYVSEAADFSGFVKYKDKTQPILLRGFIFSHADKIYKIHKNLTAGREALNENEVIVGTNLKKDLNIKLGNKIDIITPTGAKKEVTITGFYDLKSANINDSWIITNMKTAQNIFQFKDNITSIEMQVKDAELFNADVISNNLRNELNFKELKITNWKEQNASLLSGLSGQKYSSLMIQVFVILSVILGIASVLAVSVMQKSKQIGILKAMGIKDKEASLIFLFQGLILGALGTLIGVIIGLLLMYVFTKFALNPDGTAIVPLYIDVRFITLSSILAIAASTAAALVPASKSLKLNPIEVIQNG